MDEIKECEHGNTFNCLQCEVKYLKYVIEEMQEEVKDQTKWADTYFKELQQTKGKLDELTKRFKYASEHTHDFSDFYHYMSDITYGYPFNPKFKK